MTLIDTRPGIAAVWDALSAETGVYVDSAEATRKAYATQFTIGQRTLLDLLNSENEYFNAQLAFVQGRYTELASVYRALASIGILNQSLKVATACCNANANAAPASAPPVVSEQPNATPRWMLN